MSDAFLEVRDLNKSFDGIQALGEFSLSIGEGDTVGLIGPNGSGKTTLFNLIGGFIRPERGSIGLRGHRIDSLPPHLIAGLGVCRTFQELRILRQMSVLDNVLFSFRGQYGELLHQSLLGRRAIKRQEESNIQIALDFLNEAGLQHMTTQSAEELSYGQQKLLSLICCLVSDGDLFLLDEPVAGIAPDQIERVLRVIIDLSRRKKTVVLIEHNMEIVLDVCDKIVFIDSGRNICEGMPDEIRNDPRVVEAYIG